MNFIVLRRYTPADHALVGEFLTSTFRPGNLDGNWLRPAWDYMHSHPSLDVSSLGRIGIWEESGRIVAVANYESTLGEAFLQIHPDYQHLKGGMIHYAEDHLSAATGNGDSILRLYINDFDLDGEVVASSRGYSVSEQGTRPVSELSIPPTVPPSHLPRGFTLKSLADDNDLIKVNRVLWRGFNHEGTPPSEGIAWRRKVQSSPSFRKELTIVVEAPSKDFVSFCGMWYEDRNKLAYIEPLATDPDYRQMGLAKAAVWEGIRRCKVLGAQVAFVGSDEEFYRAIGFARSYASRPWVKTIPNSRGVMESGPHA